MRRWSLGRNDLSVHVNRDLTVNELHMLVINVEFLFRIVCYPELFVPGWLRVRAAATLKRKSSLLEGSTPVRPSFP